MEQWKQIIIDDIVYPYEICNKEGKVRNMKTGRILKHGATKLEYAKITLRFNKKCSDFYIHRLVATAFIPNPDNLPEVDHIDRDRTNNNVENLRWVTRKENVANSDNGRNGKRVLCVETGKIYDSITQASVETGINVGNIAKVCKGKRKTAGGFHWEYVD